jgi:hypothetical protein
MIVATVHLGGLLSHIPAAPELWLTYVDGGWSFDQRTDPGERTNRIQDHASREEIEHLAKLLLEHMQATSDPQAEAFEKALDQWRERAAQ